MACIRKLYGNDISPFDLDEQQFNRLNDYVKSIGYQIIIKRDENETDEVMIVSFKPYYADPFDHAEKYM